jgi:DnaK suppressor protein
MKQENEKTRYSETELQEFKDLLLDKLRIAKEELNNAGNIIKFAKC